MNDSSEIMPQQEERQPAREHEGREQEAEKFAVHRVDATRDEAHGHLGGYRRPFQASGLAVVLFLLSACSKPAQEGPKKAEIVDISGPADAALSYDEDIQARHRRESLSGVLPGGFPADLPLFDPASVVDSGEAENGRMMVVLQHPVALRELEVFLGRELPAAGWKLQGGSSYRNDQGRDVEISVESLGTVSRSRIVF